jgi:uncharacterized membrane protein
MTKSVIEAHAAESDHRGHARARFSWRSWQTWLTLPQGDLGVRMTLIAFVIILHNVLEAPRDLLTQALGAPITGLLAFLALSLSLWLLALALWERPPAWRWLRGAWARRLALIFTLAGCLIGLRQVGVMTAATVQSPFYPNDGATLDQYAAQQLLEGHNPYVTSNIVNAIHVYGQDAQYTTPLRNGSFAGRAWTDFPSAAERQANFPAAASDPATIQGYETRLSYPALAFLPLVPLVWAGLPSTTLLTALCWLALVILLIREAPPEWRIWVGLLALADVPLLNAAGIADPDVLYILPLFVAWRWRGRGVLSATMLGLALAAKQLAWFSAPFYAILIWRERGWRAALGRLAGAAALFMAVNLPFFANNPRAWLAGVLAPELDPMFPQGNGLIRLALSGVVPLAPSVFYTTLELLVMAGALVWYWRNCLRTPALGYVLAIAPLYFAWRSLTTYFYFTALPALALLFPARQSDTSRETSLNRLAGARGEEAQAL